MPSRKRDGTGGRDDLPTYPAVTMELHVDDAGFVRAPAAACYPVLTDLAGWAGWWPALGAREDGRDALSVRLPVGRLRSVRFRVVAGDWRHDAGCTLALSGDLVGRGEFWLEEVGGGTVVHHVLSATGPARLGPKLLDAYRWWVRRGLWGCKERVEDAVRELEGLPR